MREAAARKPRPDTRRLAFVLTVGAALVLVGLAQGPLHHFFLTRLAQQQDATLQLAAAGLRGALQRYQAMPALIAQNRAVQLALLAPQQDKQSVNEALKALSLRVEASDIYLLDRQGLTIAASNYDSPASFVGSNYHFRPYFTQAMSGSGGSYYAYGLVSKRRGYYFSAPVFDPYTSDGEQRRIGVVVVKAEVAPLEQAWKNQTTQILVSDPAGIVFMASQADWLFSALTALSPQQHAALISSRQYPAEAGQRLLVQDKQDGPQNSAIWHLQTPVGPSKGPSPYLVQTLPMPVMEWQLHILTPTRGASQQTLLALASLAGILLLSALLWAYMTQRRARLLERLAFREQQRAELERRVEERTRDLKAAQAELIQASKLAALGQMSAALSHEFNQPLSAISSYTENAQAFLARGRLEAVDENLSHILDLIQRMKTISKHLRNFARKPQDSTRPVPIAASLNDAVAILHTRFNQEQVQLITDFPPGEDLWVMAGRVRLQQVILNLLANALDSMKDANEARANSIRVSVEAHPDMLRLHVDDTGPGIDPALLPDIFDPFVTSKAQGDGLGLGLSISYNIIRDFGGRMLACNLTETGGGARFTLELQRCSPPPSLQQGQPQ